MKKLIAIGMLSIMLLTLVPAESNNDYKIFINALSENAYLRTKLGMEVRQFTTVKEFLKQGLGAIWENPFLRKRWIWMNRPRRSSGGGGGSPQSEPEEETHDLLDLNEDGIVDIQDFTIYKQCQNDNFGKEGNFVCDLNNDGLVDLQDFGLFKANK